MGTGVEGEGQVIFDAPKSGHQAWHVSAHKPCPWDFSAGSRRAEGSYAVYELASWGGERRRPGLDLSLLRPGVATPSAVPALWKADSRREAKDLYLVGFPRLWFCGVLPFFTGLSS